MLEIEAVNHVGIRVRHKDRAVEFYTKLGFEFLSDAGFAQGHPIVMRHPSGVVLNLLGPADGAGDAQNILMDVEERHTGITHVALTVASLERAKQFVADADIPITGSFSFGKMSAIFIRDPDRNVIELDAYASSSAAGAGYEDHP